MRQTISRLKRELCALFGMSTAEARGMRLDYIDAGMVEATGPEELRFGARELYTYHPNDGDTIVITRRGGAWSSLNDPLCFCIPQIHAAGAILTRELHLQIDSIATINY